MTDEKFMKGTCYYAYFLYLGLLEEERKDLNVDLSKKIFDSIP